MVPGEERGHSAEEETVQRMLRGDEDAFRDLYRSIQPGLLRYLTFLVGGDAEDVAAEAWAQAVRDLATFSGSADGFRGWITTIGRHRAMDLVRTRARRPVAEIDAAELIAIPGREATEGDVLTLVATAEVLDLIATLPPDQAEAVLLRVVADLDVATTARVMERDAGAVRVLLHRGLRRLRRMLEDAGEVTPAPRGTVSE